MLLSKVHHVAIISSDYEKAKEFYVRKLGFIIIKDIVRKDRDDRKLDLQIGEGPEAVRLEIVIQKDPPKRVSYPEAAGLRHLAFQVEDVVKTAEQLEKKGIACEPIRSDELYGGRYTFFFDPDGLPLEIHEKL